MIKLVAADLDGTTFDSQHALTKGNKEAILSLKEKNIEFLICTGRDFQGAAELFQKEGIVCNYICLNGAGTYDCYGNIEEVVPMDKESVGKILTIITNMKMIPNIATNKGAVFLGTKEEVEAYYISCVLPICTKFGILESEIEEIGKFVENRKHLASSVEELLQQDIEIYKVEVYFNDPQASSIIREKLKGIDSIATASFFPHNLEITDKKATKGNALLRYAQRRKIDKSEVFAIGDSDNDVPMLSLCLGATVAMENAVDAVKEVAQHITKSNDEDGLAYAIQKYVLPTSV